MSNQKRTEPPDDAEQSARFIATAKDREASEKGGIFEASLRVITPHKVAAKAVRRKRPKG